MTQQVQSKTQHGAHCVADGVLVCGWPDLHAFQPLRALLLSRKPAEQDAATWLAFWGFEERKDKR